MKKIISLALCILMLASVVFSIASCGNDVAPNIIGVQSGTTGQYYVDGDEDWGFKGINGYESKGYSNAGLAIQDMKNKAVKFVIVDKAPAQHLVNSIGGIKIVNVDLTKEEYAFGVDKNQEALRQSINTILKNKKSEIKAIINKYAKGENIVGIESAKKDLNRQAEQLVVATNAAFAPFEYKDGDKFVGIDIEIMKLVADELGLELVIEDMEFDSVVTSVGSHGIDVAAAGLSVNETRKKSVNFTTSYYDATQVLIVPESTTRFEDCKTVADVLAKLEEAR